MKARALRLPYATRNPSALKKALLGALREENGKKIIVFLVGGLRERIIRCEGDSIEVVIEKTARPDELSGLIHQVPEAVLVIDDCMVKIRWRGSMLRLAADDILSCKKCVPAGEHG